MSTDDSRETATSTKDGATVIATRDDEGRLWIDVIRPFAPTLRYVETLVDAPASLGRGGADESAGDGVVCAKSGGRVAAVSTEVGARVSAGTALLTLELMKMRVEVVAPRDGVVDRLHVAEGDVVKRGQALVALKASE